MTERSFPAEIDSHPGFEGAIHGDQERPRLRQEAVLLASGHARAGRIFFLHGYHPDTDRVLRQQLETHFAPAEELGLACRDMGSYFQYISAYSCADAPALSVGVR